MKEIIALLLLASSLWSGQSLTVTNAGSHPNLTYTVTPLTYGSSWRIELQLSTLSATLGRVVQFNAEGLTINMNVSAASTVEISDLWDSGNGSAPCVVQTIGITNALVRIQRDTSTQIFSCEIWNWDGTHYQSATLPFNAPLGYTPASNDEVGSGADASVGFLNVFTTIIPLRSQPPVTASRGDYGAYTFDTTTADASSHHWPVTGTALGYTSTPNQVAVALVRTSGAPFWSAWTSLRAGTAVSLDGTQSYSLADASATVTCFWQQLAGPSRAIWVSRTSCSPSITGLIFGTHQFALQVTDVNNSISTANLSAGAVATDSNGVVVNADPNVDKIFGEQLAFGMSPWGWADERALAATTLRAQAYIDKGISPPIWKTPETGTIAYRFNGATNLGSGGTTLSSAIASATTGTIAITDASKLDLGTLPTRVLVGNIFTSQEEVRICSTTGTTGAQTLTVCYDGRGYSGAGAGGNSGFRAPAQAWPMGTQVGQLKVTGSGTTFSHLMCPAASGGIAPFANGAITYSTGTVTVTAGSADIVGSGTTWNTGNNVLPEYAIRIQATHSGTPFAFIARIHTVGSTTAINMNRVFPSDADSGPYTYQIVDMDDQIPALHFTRTDGSDGQFAWTSNGCESDTQLYLVFSIDSQVNNVVSTGVHYSVANVPGYAGSFGVNFYGEDLAHRVLYYRSGWEPAHTAANVMSSQWVTSPYNAGGDFGGFTLNLGGGVIGGIAGAVLDPASNPTWPEFRQYIANGAGAIPSPGSCNTDDTRDLGYSFAWVALAAQFDPDLTFRSTWQTDLGNIYTWEQSCKHADNSWANAGFKFQPSQQLTMTNGSAAVTGTGIPASLCPVVASGTITVTNGSGVATGAGFVNSNEIIITGTMSGQPFTGFYRYLFNSSTSITLGALWPGTSGTFPYLINNSDSTITIGVDNNDPQVQKSWACTWNSATSITLNAPWDGSSGSSYFASQGGIPGYSQQPYMMGIKTSELRWASQVASVNPSGFATLRDLAATWDHDTGYDPNTQGFSYCRVMQFCEPGTTTAPGTSLDWRTPWSQTGADPGAVSQARALTGEGNSVISPYYNANVGPTAKTWADTVFGSAWGKPVYTTGGAYGTSIQASNTDDASLAAFKYTGFFFGMGMSHQWPAARLGGLQPASLRTVPVQFSLTQVAGATNVDITVTSPSSAAVTVNCTTSPCNVTVDDRQGPYPLMQFLFKSSGGSVLATSDKYPL